MDNKIKMVPYAVCAHINVKYTPTEVDENGFTHSEWLCQDCAHPFEPLDVSDFDKDARIKALEGALAEKDRIHEKFQDDVSAYLDRIEEGLESIENMSIFMARHAEALTQEGDND